MNKMFLIFSMLICFYCRAEIIQIQKIKQCEEFFHPQALVIFDLDNTVMEPAQTLGSDQWLSYRINENKKHGMIDNEAIQVALHEWVAAQLFTKVQLVEPSILEVLRNLNEKGIKVIALTSRGLELANHTINQLKKLGVSFVEMSPHTNEIFFDHLKGLVYRQGVLFASGTNKGALLFQFFKESKYQPQQILCIDDKQNCLKDIEEACVSHQIPFQGLRYGFLDKKIQSFRPEIAEEQWKSFGEIISDSAVFQKQATCQSFK